MQELIRVSTANYGHADADANRFGRAHGNADADQFVQTDAGQGEVDVHDLDTDEIVKKPGTRGKTWSDLEDLMLAESWMFVSLDAGKGAQQTRDAYWKRIKLTSTEGRHVISTTTSPIAMAKDVRTDEPFFKGCATNVTAVVIKCG